MPSEPSPATDPTHPNRHPGSRDADAPSGRSSRSQQDPAQNLDSTQKPDEVQDCAPDQGSGRGSSSRDAVPEQGLGRSHDLALDSDGKVVTEKRAWQALRALLIGFFMILVDATIVTTAMPAIIHNLHTDLDGGVWVTSAYLLTYAVPLLISGRLGDRFGTRNIYAIGMTIFTLASLACGLSGTIGMLITCRAVQGIGAALMAPQSMTLITQLFPPRIRGAAMGVWGGVAGVAGFVGPILGGVLVDSLGWEWIFLVNVPIGVIGLWRALVAVPVMPRTAAKLDWWGMVLSGIAMSLIVFGIQEGQTYDWGVIAGIISVPLLIALGVVFLGLFVWYERRMERRDAQPLVPLGLFRNRNFTLGNAAIFFVGANVSSFSLITALYLQTARGLTPTKAALLLATTAVATAICSPFAGRILQRRRSGRIGLVGTLTVTACSLLWFLLMTPTTPLWVFSLIGAVMGAGSSFVWSPVSLTTTHDLRLDVAGAGSGVNNAIRQVGSVLGSALIAAVMDWRLVATHGDLSRGFSQSMLVPAIEMGLAALVVAFFADFKASSD